MDTKLKCIASEAGKSLGYPALKPEQLDVIVTILQARDVFAVLPTGFGKSLCYTCLPLTFDKLFKKEPGHSIVMVITPLLAIMKDQVSAITIMKLALLQQYR